MTDLAPHLERLGLEQYLDAFIGEGFDTWEILTDIQESDFDALNVKLGHRRKLQRAIADYRGVSYERLVGSPAHDGLSDGGRVFDGGGASTAADRSGYGPASETKRKYRRHPKPDENAPERPPSAYVIFSNKVREEVKDQNLSFTQIAKMVGDRWQKLDPADKQPYEAQANAAKERYNIQLSTYRKTDSYKDYMQYLAEFKSKHGQATEPKRPRLDAESSGSIISAKSLEINLETSSQFSSHVRGGSVGSVASSPYTSGPAPPGAVAPSMSAMSSRPTLVSSRSGSPPGSHHGRDYFRPGLVSSHSSVSDESTTLRSDVSDPLTRTAGLSINAGAAGTPSLSSVAPTTPSLDSPGSADLPSRSRPAYPGQPPYAPSGPLGHLPGSGQPGAHTVYQPTYFSSHAPDVAWASRAAENRPHLDLHAPLPGSQSPSVTGLHKQPPSTVAMLPPLLSPDRLSDYTPGSPHRTLPPPRPPSAGVASFSQPASRSSPFHADSLFYRRPGSEENVPPNINRNESDAANTLAGLAAGVSRPDTTKSFNLPPPRSPP